jgi:hypothetical protein
VTKVAIYRDGTLWKEVGPEFREQVKVDRSGWFSLVAEGPAAGLPVEPAFPQAGTNSVRVYVGNQKIRNRQSAEYFIAWIDKLRSMTEKWPGWRSQPEKDHVYAQFDEARTFYQKLAAEADNNR